MLLFVNNIIFLCETLKLYRNLGHQFYCCPIISILDSFFLSIIQVYTIGEKIVDRWTPIIFFLLLAMLPVGFLMIVFFTFNISDFSMAYLKYWSLFLHNYNVFDILTQFLLTRKCQNIYFCRTWIDVILLITIVENLSTRINW